MSLAIVHGRALSGLSAPEVQVEVHLANGLPSFTLVGLPETEVKEARDRVRAALLTSRFEFPARRITVNLAPADLPKEGGRFDLPIALGILAASEQLPLSVLEGYEFAGELGLDGSLRPVRGALAQACQMGESGKTLILPLASAAEAALVPGVKVLAADSLLAVCAHLLGQTRLSPPEPVQNTEVEHLPDLLDVKGQQQAKRALEVAAAGGHSVLFYGPPGTGKSMLASRLPGLLPAMTGSEALEAAAVQSLAHGGLRVGQFGRRPYRAPHHTASGVALVGGGSDPRPGEISLAHHGVLFLDELPEFDRKVLEVLREPLEAGRIQISRATRQAEFPARFQLVAAMNPCPCGYHGHPAGRCKCTPEQISRYRGKLSGPLLDRIDLLLEVPALPQSDLQAPANGENSAAVQARVQQARDKQLARQGVANAQLTTQAIDRHCRPDAAGEAMLAKAMERLNLSARAYHRILRVARTIADLAGAEQIMTTHLAEAIQFRRAF